MTRCWSSWGFIIHIWSGNFNWFSRHVAQQVTGDRAGIDWNNFRKLNILFHLNINTGLVRSTVTVTMDPSTDQHQAAKLSNRKSKKGRKDSEGEDDNSFGKQFSLYLTSLQISRELVLRVVVFLIVYLFLTRIVKIFTNWINWLSQSIFFIAILEILQISQTWPQCWGLRMTI